MRRILCICLVLVGLTVFVTNSAGAAITLDVFPSSAPNVYGSPSWSGYAASTLSSLEFGLGNIGDRSIDPSAYEQILNGQYDPTAVMVTSFYSWDGEADPLAPFDKEHGNRLHFGLHAYGDGSTLFALEDLTFAITSSDSILDFSGDFIGYSYTGTTRYGVFWGADRTKGTADDVYYTSGNGTTLVDEIVYVGVGNAYWPGYDDGANDPGTTALRQMALDDTYAYIRRNNVEITGKYWIKGEYSGAVTLQPTPEPGSLMLILFGGAAFATVIRRRRKRA